MRGSFYRYQAPKLNQLKKSHMSELTPIDVFYKPKPNFSSRILTFYGDCFLISMLVSSLISLGLSMEIDTLGPYISAQSEAPISIFAFYLPIHFLVAIGYFSLSYFFNNSATPINRMNKTRVVPYQFVVDGNVKQYQLSAEQSLKRALRLTDIAASIGVDAIKLQTFKPEEMTLNIRKREFLLRNN